MKQLLLLNIDLNIVRNVLILYMFIEFIKGYPIAKKDTSDNQEFQNERTYPNGTVVGKYLYKDSDGNPIHVKYYADDSGYGVELKSVKIVPTNPQQLTESTGKPKSTKYEFKNNDDVDSITFDPIYDYKTTSNPFEVHEKNSNKKSKDKYRTNPDYEIFVDNEIKAPKKCDQDRVHVYVENNKRKVRNTLSDFDAMKYCEQLFS